MDARQISESLKARFAAPLPEFYRRRIIFWHDEDREFESMLDDIDVPEAELIRLTGTNNFTVKKLLLHDSLDRNYIIYDPFSHENQQDNWLRDIERYSEEFRADYFSSLMEEIHADPLPVMRKTVRQYSKFFRSGERINKFKKIGRTYHTPQQIQTDVMSVLADVPGGSFQDILIAVLSSGPDESSSSVLEAFARFECADDFWSLVRKYTGFIHSDDSPLESLAPHILLTALANSFPPGALRGLDRYVSDSSRTWCYSFVDEWRSRADSARLLNLCTAVEDSLHLRSRFQSMDIDMLLGGDIFPCIHEVILERLFNDIGNSAVNVELISRAAEVLRTAGWHELFTDFTECLHCIGRMQGYFREHGGLFHLTRPDEVWEMYTRDAWQMDSWYRHFHFAFGNALHQGRTVLEDPLKSAAEYVEGLYQNWFLAGLSDCWTRAVEPALRTDGFAAGIPQQRDFYIRYVKSTPKAFVVVSDALRYETAMELCEAVTRSMPGRAHVEAVQSIFPSVTKFGMAALLPGSEISVSDSMDVLVDGQKTRSTEDREAVLRSADGNSIAVQYSTIKGMKRDERRKLATGRHVVYIYHNTIDAVGDKPATEQKTFAACQDAILELASLVRSIVSDFNGTDIIVTADHGFLYTYSPLRESDKIGTEAVSGEIYEAGHRSILASPEASSDFLLPVSMEKTVSGRPMKGFTPRDTTRIRTAGGGVNYVHGGISLQETAVPVLVYKNTRAGSKEYTERTKTELKVLTESRKISNLLFYLDLYQTKPAGEKVQPCTYSVYMRDSAGTAVSDRQTVIADRTSANASDRIFRLRFSLKTGSYDRHSAYWLVIDGGDGTVSETEFRIDIALADDFGFDL